MPAPTTINETVITECGQNFKTIAKPAILTLIMLQKETHSKKVSLIIK